MEQVEGRPLPQYEVFWMKRCHTHQYGRKGPGPHQSERWDVLTSARRYRVATPLITMVGAVKLAVRPVSRTSCVSAVAAGPA